MIRAGDSIEKPGTRGTVGFRIGREKLVAGPGKRLAVPTGAPHKFWNAGEEVAHFVCEVRPALQFESLVGTMFFQRIGLALGSPVGRARGYEPVYVPSPAPAGLPAATAA